MNPLLSAPSLPAFSSIRAEHVEPAIRQRVAEVAAGLDELERTVQPTWASAVGRMSRLYDPLGWAWGTVGHLVAVRNAPDLRAAHQAVQGAVVELSLRVGQSKPLYQALVALRDGADFAALDSAQQRVVTTRIRDAEHSGVGLEGEAKERFTRNAQELAELSTRFQNHVLDATKAFAMDLTDAAEIAGLPASARAAAAAAYAAAHNATPDAERGPWRITLDGPSFQPFMEHATRRDLRERLYRAFVTRASSGAHDNQPLIDRILALRKEQAGLLGFASYAEQSVAAKMAGSVAAVENLLNDLRAAALPKAKQELAELEAFAGSSLSLWDVPFWAERMREHRYAVSDDQLRPYFALPTVLDGLFALAERIFDVRIRAADGEAEVWHPDVRFFRITDAEGNAKAAFFLDPYSRPADKRGGAWMDVCLERWKSDHTVRLPVAYLVCNQTPPVGTTPSLMTFREVETLFHEFGHGLQHMLTTVDHVEASGINNVEWDAVELPSQFMENWCYDRATVIGTSAHPGIGRHWQTGAPLPTDLFERLCAARTYRAGSMTLRQINFSLLDIELHHRFVPGGADDVIAVQRRIAAANAVIPPLPEDRFLCSFSHIFAGGYAAGYYSYKWAEVLSADAFAAFTDVGLDNENAVRATGRRFRDTVLAQGGSRHPLAIFTDFRGRAPSPAALLKQTGLA
jgi:oligopeptidase A